MPKIAFLGTGAMGTPMARRLLAAGLPVTVWNRTADRARALAADGAEVRATAADAVRDADIVLTMLADPTAVREVVGAASAALRPGTHLVELSTIGPGAVAALAAALPEGVVLIDAPVMGSVDRAAAGTLSILAGGDADPVEPVLARLGTVTRCGGPGSGAALKLVLINAVIGAVTLTGEALALADAFGLPEPLVAGQLAKGPLGAALGRAGAEGSEFPLRLAAKDVRLAVEAADLPMLDAARAHLTAFPESADRDLGGITALLRTPAGTPA